MGGDSRLKQRADTVETVIRNRQRVKSLLHCELEAHYWREVWRNQLALGLTLMSTPEAIITIAAMNWPATQPCP